MNCSTTSLIPVARVAADLGYTDQYYFRLRVVPTLGLRVTQVKKRWFVLEDDLNAWKAQVQAQAGVEGSAAK